MKKLLLGAIAVIGAVTTASAADMAPRPYAKAPALAAPIPAWAGFYIGAMGGYAHENTSANGAISGGFAGGTIGYNWQSGPVVFGLEADAAWADVGAAAGVPGILTLEARIRDLGTVRGRIGYAFNQVWSTERAATPGSTIGSPLPCQASAFRIRNSTPAGPPALASGIVCSEMVGQGRVPLPQLLERDLLRHATAAWRCLGHAQSQQRTGRRELSLLGTSARLPGQARKTSVLPQRPPSACSGRSFHPPTVLSVASRSLPPRTADACRHGAN